MVIFYYGGTVFSTINSNYKEEIELFLAKGGIINELPPKENPRRISAKPRIYEEEDNDETLNSMSLFVDGGIFYKRGRSTQEKNT